MEAAAQRLGNAFRPGTMANNRSHVLLFAAFTSHFQLQDFPAAPRSLVLFGEFLLRSFRAPKSVTNAISAVRAFHLDVGLDVGAFGDRQLFLFRRSLPLTSRHVPTQAPPDALSGVGATVHRGQGGGGRGVGFRNSAVRGLFLHGTTFLSGAHFSLHR